ncbi:unnamed protein product [Rotaria sordida]|uniref:Uncharacterized protein n=1 Tax=Rotaria sordida TaxID=392033 RepID=A0A819CAX4_9BILA|nr:unnamed protein product [Rotaria sordida]CAF3808827.1 unnamed protein product [Rotaria sordida]
MGCGSSFSTLPSINNKTSSNTKITTDTSINKSNKLSSINLEQKLFRNKNLEDKSFRDKNLEPFTLICLDEHFNENDKQLRSIIDYVCCFNDFNECEEFITDINKNNFIFFIVSNEHFTNIISYIHELSQVIAIYVYQDNKQDNYRKENIDKHWIKRYSKLKGVYFDREILLEQLTLDVKISININDLIPITVYSRIDAVQTNNNSNDHLRFLFYQLFIKQYCLNSSSILNKNDFIDIIQNYYDLNRKELKLIQEFNNEYNSNKNIFTWFIRDCFIRRMLTQSLLKLDIQILFSLRFFIKDMFKLMIENVSISNQKQNFYSNNSGRYTNGRSTQEQIFYRGQALSKETLFKIKSNLGEILSINNFILASKNRQDSLGFIRKNIPPNDLVYRVLFEMKIPLEYSLQKQRPFIDINYLNDNNKLSNEDVDDNNLYSILFFIGSIFRINTVVFDINNDCWIIQLTLYDEKINQDFSQVFTFLNDIKRTNTENAIALANLLRQISPNSAEQFYKHLLKKNSESISKLECYRGLGLCSYSKDNSEQALDYFEKALNLKPNDKLIKSSLHNSIGLVYAQQDQIDEALLHFNKALENTSLPLHIACVHHNLALIYSKQEKYEKELEHYQEALKYRTGQLPSYHLQLASLHNNIGIAYSDMHEYDRALTNLRKALDMRLKLLSDTHIDVARSYANIGTVYAKTQEFRMALEYFNKASLLFEKQQQIPQQDIEQLDRNIKIVNDKLRRKTY